MILLPGYRIGTLIYESVNSLVYRGQRERDGLPVVLKILKSDRATPTELARYQQEYHITQRLELDGIARAYELAKDRNTVAIVLEDFGGVSLQQELAERQLTLSEFLSIASQIAEILGQIHAAGVVHKDINPANILYNRELDRVKLIDFGISIELSPDTPLGNRNPTILEGTLPYMSPEQTGRTNCPLDYRSDFYSLGVTFYEMLLGRPTFDTTDTMELVHCHIAGQPTPPRELDPSIPQAVSDIVMKLLEKTPEERYQSAWGIQVDLVLCLMQLEATGTIEDVIPGENDVVNQFRIPPQLYGREIELARLRAAFERVGAIATADGNAVTVEDSPRPEFSPPEVVFVVGDAGIGKSALVGESYKPVRHDNASSHFRDRAYFVSGQFESGESLRSEIPFAPVVEAVRELVRQLLTETESQLAGWRDRLLETLGDACHLLVRAVPELKLVLESPTEPELGIASVRASPDESWDRSRLKSALQRFLQVFCHSNVPLVLFFDNLQWSDAVTLEIVEAAICDPHSRSLLVIGAYREGEVGDDHPLRLLRHRLQRQSADREYPGRVETLVLDVLPLEAIVRLVADTLDRDRKSVMPLAMRIAQKTNGNPFFVREFLKTLDRENLLVFDDESMSWQWDLERIDAQEIADNVLSGLLAQLQQLPDRARELLSLGACMGMEFDLDVLHEITRDPLRDLFHDLVPALVEGLVQPRREQFVTSELPLEPDDRPTTFSPSDTSTRSDTDSLTNIDIKNTNVTLSNLTPSTSDKRGVLLLSYQFLHPQVQQAAYSLVGADRKDALHLQIGKVLYRRRTQRSRIESETERETNSIIEVVRHWNLARGAIADDTDKLQRGRLNLEAGRQSFNERDYTSALTYDLIGIEALPMPMWKICPELAFSLHLERARANLLQGNFDRTIELLDLLDRQAPDDGARIEIDRLAVAAYQLCGRYGEAFDRVTDAIERVSVTRRQSPVASEDSSQETGLSVSSLSSLFSSSASPPPEIRLDSLPTEAIAPTAEESAVGEVLARALVLLHVCAPSRVARLAAESLERARTLGRATLEMPVAAALYGVSHLAGGDRPTASDWANFARTQVEQLGDGDRQCWVYGILGSHVLPWTTPLPKALSLLEEAYRLSTEHAEIFAIGYSLAERLCLSFYGGKSLESLARDATQWMAWCRKYQHRWALDRIASVMLPVSMLSEKTPLRSRDRAPSQDGVGQTATAGSATESPSTDGKFRWGQLTESIFLERCRRFGHESSAASYYVHKAWVLYGLERYEEALEAARTARERSASLSGSIAIALNDMAIALCSTALFEQFSPEDRENARREIETVRQHLDSWAEVCPETFACWSELVTAEWERLYGRNFQALDRYDRAIELASANDAVQWVALGNELAGRFWCDRGKPKIAKLYFGEAYVAYQRWGATGKVRQFDRRYGSLLTVAVVASQDDEEGWGVEGSPRTNRSINYTRSRAAVLDVATVMKAAQALSGEIVLDRLLDKLMELALENAGATGGSIVFVQNDRLTVEISQRKGLRSLETTQDRSVPSDESQGTAVGGRRSLPVEQCDCLPLSTLHYVARTGESVVLNDATAESAFVNDSYIRDRQPKSLLCAPIQGQGKLIGILYLENSLTAGAFTRDRLDVLMLLCAQAAISLENARLYENLKQSELHERERATQLRDSLQELQQAQLQLVQSEKMATLGQLVAGVAHEINNPVGFVDANLSHAQGYIEDIIGLLEMYREEFPDPGEDIDAEIEEIDLDFIVKDLPQILDSMKVGTERIRQISRSLRTFSRADTSAKVAVDLHEGIDSTLMILKPRLKFTKERPTIEVVKEYGDLPQIECYAGQLNQVFTNIIANAIDALDEASRDRSFEDLERHPNRIVIRTELDDTGDRVRICIRDNGPGMTEDVRQQIFDRMFTTKAVGKGTGLGLSISRQIVVEKHGGQLTCRSTLGEGTEFVIEIPTS
ncbi:AAA family ATPase [Geitlerinema sp. CS-897]|nr:AAA family ATPase [Geitlerinema sp. CS-897]